MGILVLVFCVSAFHFSKAFLEYRKGDQIYENAMEVLQAIIKLKPAAAKGTYVKSVTVSSTMSPGVKVDPKSINK